MKENSEDRASIEKKLRKRVEKKVEQLKQAEKNRKTLLAESVSLGVLGLIFVLPVIAGAYLGRWLDGKYAGYSIRWTLSFIFVGLIIGAINVYFLIRE
ncbi:MAG: AtpZ/AtpI family protein [Nitrospiria bacterium]